MLSGIRAALVGSIVMAAVSTGGDFIWATWITQHRAIYGLTHGTLLFVVAGLLLGVRARRPGAGAVSGALVGALAAASFYALAPSLGYSAMFVSWVGLWMALAVADARLNARRPPLPEIAARGAVAAAASGLAFYGISGIWNPFDPSGWDYAVHFGAWAIAYFPGFASLFTRVAPAAGRGSLPERSIR